jgi:hypothetical protein
VEHPLALVDLVEEDGGLGHRKRTSASSNRSIKPRAKG